MSDALIYIDNSRKQGYHQLFIENKKQIQHKRK